MQRQNNDSNLIIYDDSELLEKITNDSSYDKDRELLARVGKNRSGRLVLALRYKQLIPWSTKSLGMKMATMYMASRDYFAEAGIPEDLLDIAMIMFGVMGGRPVSPDLAKTVQLMCALWHARAVRTFRMSKAVFVANKNVVSIGCGAALIEIFALIASGSKTARLTLVDLDPTNIRLAKRVVRLFVKHGYSCLKEQVFFDTGDIRTYSLPKETDAVLSIGLLYNYLSSYEAGLLVKKWFNNGVTEVITDICYDPKTVTGDFAEMIINVIKNAIGWKIGPGGLLFCSAGELHKPLEGNTAYVYNHGANATVNIVKQGCKCSFY